MKTDTTALVSGLNDVLQDRARIHELRLQAGANAVTAKFYDNGAGIKTYNQPAYTDVTRTFTADKTRATYTDSLGNSNTEQSDAVVYAEATISADATAALPLFQEISVPKDTLVTLAVDMVNVEGLAVDANRQTTTPTGVTATAQTSGGALGAVTRHFKITAIDDNGESLASAEVSDTTDGTGSDDSIDLAWTAVTGATKYRVYVSDSGAGNEDAYIDDILTNSYTYTGDETPTAGLPPTDPGATLTVSYN